MKIRRWRLLYGIMARTKQRPTQHADVHATPARLERAEIAAAAGACRAVATNLAGWREVVVRNA